MAPRSGGEADKLGNRYEGVWAVRHALHCLRGDDRVLTMEELDPELARGSEFTFTDGGATQAHQAKRQYGNNNEWTIKVLAGRGVFKAAAGHVAAGREFHFVSLIGCGPLRELSERARSAVDLAAFTQHALASSKELRAAFDEVTSDAVLGSTETAYTTLRGMWFEVHEERITRLDNALIAELTLTGANGHLMALAIADVLDSNLGRPLTGADILAALIPHGITERRAGSRTFVRNQVAEVTANWRRTVERELLDPPIQREEADKLVASLEAGRFSLLVGNAGDGKSAVLEQAATSLEASGGTVLAFRLDRRGEFSSTAELGRELELGMSPAAALSLVAGKGRGFVLIDQLDAVSLASGRMPENFDAVADLVAEALLLPNVSVVLACRGFDLDNDHRIRTLTSHRDLIKIEVGDLPDIAVNAAVTSMGLDPTLLTANQRDLLRRPLHLVLLAGIASHPEALAFRSRGSLFEAFWERKREAVRSRRSTVRFNEVVERVGTTASDRQTLSVPIEVLDTGDLIEDAKVLISEHVLARDADRVGFFHEAFFDYAFARQWVSRSESLVDFLCRDEQELFRRAQVRQILEHLHEREPDRFLEECESVLTTGAVRFHIKQMVIAVIANLQAPTAEESAAVLRIAATNPTYVDRLLQQLRRPQWFARFRDDGVLDQWLDSTTSTERDLAAMFLGSQVRDDPTSVTRLLASRQDAADYPGWLRWAVRFCRIESSREMFNLFLAGVRGGTYIGLENDLWMSVNDLGKTQPAWAVELLGAYLMGWPTALDLDECGHVALLRTREHYASELVQDCAQGEPLAFVEMALPYMRTVMAATALPASEDGIVRDQHFSHRLAEASMYDRNLDDALQAATVGALERLAAASPDDVRTWLDVLATDPYETSQYLLYRAMAAGGPAFAEQAADLLLQGGRRHRSGYSVTGARWAARELVVAVAPHVDADKHRRLEEMFRDLENPRENGHTLGSTAFMFLSALDAARLTPEGSRRLGEYRLKFDEDAPSAPTGITGGTITSPIHADAAALMTDRQWLDAMAKYHSEEPNWNELIGGAHELSSEFRDCVSKDPVRFAHLALAMTADLNSSYASAMLMGLGDNDFPLPDPEPLFAAVRHLSGLGQPEVDRWLGWALRRHQRVVPIDLVELLLDRAMHSLDPVNDEPRITRQDKDGNEVAHLYETGINTTRGTLAESVGDLIIRDATDERAELVRPHLADLATDASLAVRACVAHVLGASLRHALDDALAAFSQLIDADDSLLAAPHTARLIVRIGNINPEVIEPVVDRMLLSTQTDVRRAGGELAAFAALEWARPRLMARALSLDSWVRRGVAQVCANNFDRTTNATLATKTLGTLMHDTDQDVRAEVSNIAGRLRERPLRQFAELLSDLITSPAYSDATPQLLITLQHAPDRVDDLALKAAQRFLEVFSSDVSDIRTSAAGDALYVSELVVRGLAQSRSREQRAALLDVLDSLLEIGAYGIDEAISAAGRD